MDIAFIKPYILYNNKKKHHRDLYLRTKVKRKLDYI